MCAVCIAATFFLLVAHDSQAAVTLSFFRATYTNGDILVEWETASEIDMAGFYLKRSNVEDGEYIRISGFISSEGEISFGWYYTFLDTNIIQGEYYCYILEAVEIDQGIEEHGPVCLTA